MRGEDLVNSVWAVRMAETPPHAWGRLFPFFPFGPYDRNTPTCVGKTFIGNPLWVCGIETPPHAWGRLREHLHVALGLGNTPTCVGKTVLALIFPVSLVKHPHMRGEDCSPCRARPRSAETPPHAWGRPCLGKIDAIRNGNTPTCVGKTLNDH